MSRDKESLIEKAAEITAMQEAYSYLTTKFEFGDEMLDDVLALENPLKYFADRWLLPVSDVFDVDMDIRENIAGIRDSQEYLCQREPTVSVLARLQNAAQEVRECPLRRNRYAILVHGNGPETILRWEVYRCLMYLYQRI